MSITILEHNKYYKNITIMTDTSRMINYASRVTPQFGGLG